MKLSNREKVLISILLIAVVVYVGYTFMPFDNLFNLDELENEYNLKKSEYDTMSQNIISKTNYETKFNELSQIINSTNMISNIQQEQVLVFLNNYSDKNNIDLNSIGFTESMVIPVTIKSSTAGEKDKSTFETTMDKINKVSEANVNSEINQLSESETSEAVDASENNEKKNEDLSESTETGLTIRSISSTISFKSSYYDMIKFIDDIQNYPMDISITNINTVAGEGGLLQGSMTLNFYSIPKLESFIEENKDWAWTDLVPFGKGNPFSADASSQAIASVGSSFDFSMSLMPESSDLPTLIVGKTDDDSRITYLYADSNTIESVDFEFKSENNKYFYKYKTKNGFYPNDGTWKEFTPILDGNVNIKIISSKKNSKTDSAGANIGVNNTSGLKIRFIIEGDDSNDSRVFFKDPKSVSITRK